MKAFFVTICKSNSPYSMITEVQGENEQEFAYNGIQNFDKEMISGEKHTKQELIELTAKQYAENLMKEAYYFRKEDLVPYLANYLDPEYITTYLIYVDNKGELVKKDATKHMIEFFKDIPKEVETCAKEMLKQKRKEQYQKLKEEFGD